MSLKEAIRAFGNAAAKAGQSNSGFTIDPSAGHQWRSMKEKLAALEKAIFQTVANAHNEGFNSGNRIGSRAHGPTGAWKNSKAYQDVQEFEP